MFARCTGLMAMITSVSTLSGFSLAGDLILVLDFPAGDLFDTRDVLSGLGVEALEALGATKQFKVVCMKDAGLVSGGREGAISWKITENQKKKES